MKIAVVSPYALDVPGGVQQQAMELSARLCDAGNDAYVVAPRASDLPNALDVGGSVAIRANGAIAPIALSPRAYRRVGEAVASADVVHVHEPFMPLVGWAAMRAEAPTVLTFHADPSSVVRVLYRAGTPALRRLLRGAGAVSAVSAVARTVVGPLFDPIELIPNGLDVASYRVAVERIPRQVVFLGRPDPRKGRDLLLAAWPAVRQRMPDATLVVIGGGDTPSIEGVRFAGRVDEGEKRRILASSSVFCAPNRGGESFGITVTEGMAAGCAVVASDLAAFVDVLDGSGVLFKNGDRKALGRALGAVVSDVDLQRERAGASSARVEQFDWDVVVDRYLDLYRSALEP